MDIVLLGSLVFHDFLFLEELAFMQGRTVEKDVAAHSEGEDCPGSDCHGGQAHHEDHCCEEELLFRVRGRGALESSWFMAYFSDAFQVY